jgi:hypothetical protein
MRRELLLLREMRDAGVAIRTWSVVEAPRWLTLKRCGVQRSCGTSLFLGEAASQVHVETKDAHPQIACRAATRLRNRIVHGYWDIDVETLVATAVDDLPQMISYSGVPSATCTTRRPRPDRLTPARGSQAPARHSGAY